MAKIEVVIVDYGAGNLLSVQRAVEKVGAIANCTSHIPSILSAKRLILPGVGAFSSAMRALQVLNLIPVLRELASRGTPFLGICLGMQLLFEESEEFGKASGLGIIPGRIIPVDAAAHNGQALKIPHIGWNELYPANGANWRGSVLSENRPGDSMYFVHSFMAQPIEPHVCLAETRYGGNPITAAVQSNNVIGCQFHPEKSGKAGLALLRRFIEF